MCSLAWLCIEKPHDNMVGELNVLETCKVV